MPVTIDEMIRAAGRELGMRKAVYHRWVGAARKIGGVPFTQEKADHEIACMDAIYALLKRAKEEGWPPP